jgi:hypothetical protein
LPYRIAFQDLTSDPEDGSAKVQNAIPASIKYPEALAAYLDLVTTAEIALPAGDEDWSDPLKRDLWKKVTLGARYRLTPDEKPVAVLVRLTGDWFGYTVKDCRIATDAEFSAFESDLARWQETLREYFKVYVE